MNKTVWCDAGLFKGLFYYGFCPNEKAWEKSMKSFGLPNNPYPTSHGRCTFLSNKGGKPVVLVTIMDGAENNYSHIEIAGIIVHEGIHVWQQMCNTVGEDAPSVEFEAYSVQKIFQELMTAFEATRGKK